MQTITILIPVYNNASTIEYLCNSIQSTINNYPNFCVQLLLADDASTDGSFDKMIALKEKYDNISLLQLAYNHTQQYAFLAAIHYVKSDYLIYISADLQEESAIIEKYLNVLKTDDRTDLYVGFREENKDFLIFRILSRLFYMLVRLKVPNMPENGFDTGCVKQSILQKFIKEFKKKDLVQAVLVNCAPSVKQIPYTRQKSSSDKIKIKSLIFKIKYFVLSLISVYSKNKNTDKIYFSVKKYIP